MSTTTARPTSDTARILEELKLSGHIVGWGELDHLDMPDRFAVMLTNGQVVDIEPFGGMVDIYTYNDAAGFLAAGTCSSQCVDESMLRGALLDIALARPVMSGYVAEIFR